MSRNRKIALGFFIASAMSITGLPAEAQVATQSVITTPAPAPKIVRARFEVLHMMGTAIQVRSLVDQRQIHTFGYSDQIRGRMQAMFNQGHGYQYGDKVEIRYRPGTEVALKIEGKPSKPH